MVSKKPVCNRRKGLGNEAFPEFNPQGIYPDAGNDRTQCHFRRSGGLCPPEENSAFQAFRRKAMEQAVYSDSSLKKVA